MAEQLLLGVDEGTTGVKAALFDRELRPVREARRDKVNRHPQPGWVEQDGEEVLSAVVEAIAEVLTDAPGEVVACGLDHQGESVLAWDAESGRPLSPIVVWQDKRSQEVLDRLADREDEVKAASGLPFDPYFSAAKLAWLLEHEDAVRQARERGTLRMGTVDSFLCDRLGAGFATDPSTASRTQLQRIDAPGSFDPGLLRDLRRPAGGAAGDPRDRRRARHPGAPELAGRACALRPDRRPAGGARRGRRRRARPGQGHLRDRRLRPRPRRRAGPRAGRWPAADGRLDDRRPDRVRARRRRLRRRGDARVALPRARTRRSSPQRSARWPARPPTPAARGPARDRRARGAVVAPGRTGSAGRDHGRHDRSAGGARGARGHRLAGRRHRRGDPRERRGRQPARRRRAHQRAADARAPGRRDRGPGRGGGRRRDGARRRGAGGGRPGMFDSLAEAAELLPVDRTVEPRATTPGARPSTGAGASSCRRPPRSTRSRRAERGGVESARSGSARRAGAADRCRRRAPAPRRSTIPMPSSNSIWRTGPV